MFGLLRRAFTVTPERRAERREERRAALQEHRDAHAAERREAEFCAYCRGSELCHFCGGVRNNSPHELGTDCRHCRDGRCAYCS